MISGMLMHSSPHVPLDSPMPSCLRGMRCKFSRRKSLGSPVGDLPPVFFYRPSWRHRLSVRLWVTVCTLPRRGHPRGPPSVLTPISLSVGPRGTHPGGSHYLEVIHLLWVLSRPNTLILAVSAFGVFAHSIMIGSVQSPYTSYIYLLFLPAPLPISSRI